MLRSFSINFQTGQPSLEADVALHFNPRLDSNQTVLNSKRDGVWDQEEKLPLILVQDDGNAVKVLQPGHTAQIVFKGERDYYTVILNGHQYGRFHHRIRPDEVTHFRLQGDAETPKSIVYNSTSVIIPPSQMYWRILGGGHFLQVIIIAPKRLFTSCGCKSISVKLHRIVHV